VTPSSPSEGAPQGIRGQFRLLIAQPTRQRFDSNGRDVLEVRGTVVDSAHRHPEVVVRFAGQRQNELYRWAVVGQHLSVDGYLEVKHWLANGQPRVTLLVEAVNIFPLSDPVPDLRRIGIYATPSAPSEGVTVTSLDKTARENRLRTMLAET